MTTFGIRNQFCKKWEEKSRETRPKSHLSQVKTRIHIEANFLKIKSTKEPASLKFGENCAVYLEK